MQTVRITITCHVDAFVIKLEGIAKLDEPPIIKVTITDTSVNLAIPIGSASHGLVMDLVKGDPGYKKAEAIVRGLVDNATLFDTGAYKVL